MITTETTVPTTEATVPTTTEDPEITAMREVLDRGVIYDGIWIDSIDLSGKTYAEAKQIMQQQEDAYLESFKPTLTLGDSSWVVSAADAGISSDWKDQLEKAWQTGRTGTATDPEALIRERFAAVEQLKTEPLKLKISRTWDKDMIRQKIEALAAEVNIAAVGAKATDFDVESKKFIIVERESGRNLLIDDTLALVVAQLEEKKLHSSVDMVFEKTHAGMTAAELGENLVFVSEGKTLAKAINEGRDTNIRLILKGLSGLVLNAGEEFSFNDYFGKRTAAKGYELAGGIIGGILQDTYGGGICQPNTTLYQAVLKADLQIIERHPHSWPITYAAIGLDATVSWGGPNFRFANNTDYPIAFVAYYKKPAVIVQIYGRPLADGASISLTSELTETIPVAPPVSTLNETLPAGTVVVTRDEHIGMRAVSYKVWSKNGSVFKTELVAKSYYRPLYKIEEYGPPLPTPLPTEPTTAVTEATTAATEATTAATEAAAP